MNELLYSPKIKPEHLARKAIVYLRQSSERQVRQNLESQRLQYELAGRIRGLGWQDIEVIEESGIKSGVTRRGTVECHLRTRLLSRIINPISRSQLPDPRLCAALPVCRRIRSSLGTL